LEDFAADMISGGTMLLMAPANQAATNTNTNTLVAASSGDALPGAAAGGGSSSSFWLVPVGEADNAAAAGLVPVTYQAPTAGQLQCEMQLDSV
jgi:hypothetical protein